MARAALLSALVLALAPRPAAGDQTDYLPHNPEWNGCSALASLSRGLQLDLELLEQVDWGHIPRGSTLFFLYPTAPLESRHLVLFLKHGGKVLLADDYGRAERALAALRLHRVSGVPVSASRYHNGNKDLPVATAWPRRHALARGISSVVTNHPAFFRSEYPTLVGFGAGRQLVVAGRLGQGRFVALADPSVLINAMLRFDGNRRLAENIVRYLRPDPPAGRIYLVTRHFRTVGRPGPPRAAEAGSLQQFLTDYGRFLGRVNDFAPEQQAIRVFAVVAGAGALIGLALLLPLRGRQISGHWLRPRNPVRAGAADGDPARPDGHNGRRDAALSAAVLREEIEDQLTEALQAPGPVFTVRPAWVVRRVREVAGDEASRLCARLLSAMEDASHTANQSGIAPLRAVSRKELAAMYELSRRLLMLLGRTPLPEVSSAGGSRQARPHGADHR